VLGQGASPKPPRWSVYSDVLGWGRRAEAGPQAAPGAAR
jgi:hypothetical protein